MSSQSDSSDCMNCLESSNPSSCQEQQQCKAGEYCPDFYIGFCKKCIYNIFIAWMQCVGITNVQRLTNCVVDSVSYGHCKSCVCWAACKFGLRNVCNCCKHGQCSQSRIDPDMQSMVASGRNGEIKSLDLKLYDFYSRKLSRVSGHVFQILFWNQV